MTAQMSRRWPVLYAAMVTALGAPVFGQASQWTDIATPDLAGAGHDGHRGAAWADYDGDGDLDLYVTHWGPVATPLPGSPNQLFQNQGGGVLVDITPSPIDGPGGVAWGLSHHPAWGDIDNDGLLDLYITQSSNFGADTSRMFRQTAPGVFADVTNDDPLAFGGALPRAVSWVDHDLDGRLDLFVTNSGGDGERNRLMRNMSDGTFQRVHEQLEEFGRESRGAAWCDFNNDGLPDVYIGNGAEDHAPVAKRTNALYLNVGRGRFVNIAAYAGVDHVGHARGVFWGDVNNDGWFDLVVGNNRGSDVIGYNAIFVNNGDLTFSDWTGFSGIRENTRTRDVSMADYDNDGFLDIYVADFGGQNPPNRLWRNNGNVSFTNVAAGTPIEAPLTGNGGAWGDVDEDGWLDLFVVGSDTDTRGSGTCVLAHNDNQNGNHWLEVDLTGVVSNRLAVGARVTAVVQGAAYHREVQSGAGYNVQHMHRVHFGLGKATRVALLVVQWPSGRLHVQTDVAVDQIVEITEDPNGPFKDCNANGVPDSIDVMNGTAADCDHDGVLDECDSDPCEDCNGNGVWDALEFAAGLAEDCDGNGTPDTCDVATNPALDQDGDGDIDFCDMPGDANGDRQVDVNDLVQVISAWGPCPLPCPTDLNGDGFVDVNDLVIVIINWS